MIKKLTSKMFITLFILSTLSCIDAVHHPTNVRRFLRENTNNVFWRNIGNQSWSIKYKNPCHAFNEDYKSNLNITSRENIFRSYVGNLYHHLNITQYGNCPENYLTTLPEEEEIDLKNIYNSFLYLSAHFRIMTDDWNRGRSCWKTQNYIHNTIINFSFIAQRFEHGMCFLMHPNDIYTPFPNDDIQNEIYKPAIQNEIISYRYHCFGKIARDCMVITYAQKLLNKIFFKNW